MFDPNSNCLSCRFAELGDGDEAKRKSQLRYQGVTMVASAQGAKFAGFNPIGLPAVYTHVNSEKVICLIDLEEAIFWYCDKNKLTADRDNVPPLKDWQLRRCC